MKALTLALWMIAAAGSGGADTLVAATTIRPKTILTDEMLVTGPAAVPGGITDRRRIVGREARVVLYPGRPIRAGDIGPAALVDRNQIVILVYTRGGLSIETAGRALGRAGPGESLRVMNTASRRTVEGEVLPDGRVLIGGTGERP